MSDGWAKFPLLQELGEDLLRELPDFLEERSVAEGAVLFHRGDEADEMLLLREGRIQLEVQGSRVGELGPGSILGAGSLISVGRRECQAVAASALELFVLKREGYLRLRADAPGVALALQEAILRDLSAALRAALRA